MTSNRQIAVSHKLVSMEDEGVVGKTKMVQLKQSEANELGNAGNYGAEKVKSTLMNGIKGINAQMMDNAKIGQAKKLIQASYKDIYEFNQYPPDCFVAQMAYTTMNSFLLTTEGRLFSWGALHYCLGRNLNPQT